MSIRDDLAVLIGDLINVWRIGYDSTDPDGDMLGERVADGVLAWLGRLDPAADPELIAWHLRTNAEELDRLRAIEQTLNRIVAAYRLDTCPDREMWDSLAAADALLHQPTKENNP